MSEFYAFAGNHPILTFVLAYLACWTLGEVAKGLGKFRFVEKKESRKP